MSTREFANLIAGGAVTGKNLLGRGGQFYGVYNAVVTNNKDPEDRYRVKVKFPWLYEEGKEESSWARIAIPMASVEYGFHFLPEVDDEVLIAFQGGDPNRPFVIGCLYNGVNKAIAEIPVMKDDVGCTMPNNGQDGKNDFRAIHSRMKHTLMFSDKDGEGAICLRTKSGNELVLDDKDGKEKVQLLDKNKDQWLEIDVKEKKITLQTDQGDILIKAKKTITLECKDLVVKAEKTIEVESGTDSKWKAGGTVKHESGGTFDLKGGGNMKAEAPKIDLNP